ncbi:putative nucleic acid binding protein [Grimontella sp. AG753]|nr:putative nucleic acid binding protein [Grimontella sp. AG753]
MRKFIALSLLTSSFTSIADNTLSSEIQPYPDYLAAYVKTLITTGCEQTLKGGSEDVVIKRATQGMKEGTPSFYTVHNAIVLGAGVGKGLKESGKLTTKDKIEIDSCGAAAAYTMMQKDFMKMVVDEMVNSEQPKIGAAKPKMAASDDSIYRTTAKELAELYNANEVAADDKIGGRKLEITGLVQDIRKDFANGVVVQLQSGNKFLPVRLNMDESERTKAAKLRKGQETTITCEKMVLLVGAPSGGKCTFN